MHGEAISRCRSKRASAISFVQDLGQIPTSICKSSWTLATDQYAAIKQRDHDLFFRKAVYIHLQSLLNDLSGFSVLHWVF